MGLQIISETLPALQQLKQQGLVRFIGITGLPFKSLTYVLDRVPTGAVRAMCGAIAVALNHSCKATGSCGTWGTQGAAAQVLA